MYCVKCKTLTDKEDLEVGYAEPKEYTHTCPNCGTWANEHEYIGIQWYINEEE